MEKAPSTLPPAPVLGMIRRAAAVRGIRRGNDGAILAAMETMGADLFAGGRDLFASLFRTGDAAGPAGDIRGIGDAFWRDAFACVEKRRGSGSFYTPTAIIDRILDLIWEDLFPGGIVPDEEGGLCDPAMGCGYFLLRMAERLLSGNAARDRRVRSWAARNLFGVDNDPAVVFLARAFLWLALSDSREEFLPNPEHFRHGDSLLGPSFAEEAVDGNPPGSVDWRRAFPAAAAAGGFRVVIGNPPYEVLTGFGKHPGRRALSDALRSSGRYRDSLAGQINLYRCFVERSLDLLRPGGALSMIVPLSLTRDGAARRLRRRLLTEEAAGDWILFGEDERVFSGVTQSACIFRAVRGGGSCRRVTVTARGGTVEYPLESLEMFGGGDPLIPALGPEAGELWRWLLDHCPGRLPDIAEMRVGEVDQTMYRDCMRDEDTGCVLARGAHLAPFRLDVRPDPGRERFLDLAAFLARKGRTADLCRERADVTRVAQLGIRNLHSRPRLVAALAPPGVYFGNSLNAYWPRPGVSAEYLAGLLNSRLLDWLFRLGSGNNNINLLEMRRLPVPVDPPAGAAEAVAEAFRRAARAAAAGETILAVRRDLDAAVERCYQAPEDLLARAAAAGTP